MTIEAEAMHTREGTHISYNFAQLYDIEEVYALLRDVARDTKSILRLSMQIARDYHPLEISDGDKPHEKTWINKLYGDFIDIIRVRNSNISFTLEEELEREDKILFKSIQFSRFELQEFDYNSQLTKYVEKLIGAMAALDSQRTTTS